MNIFIKILHHNYFKYGSLEENDIEYIYQCNKSKFDWLGLQSLDFYLPKYNAAIECQGEQHFIATNFGSSKITNEQGLKIIQKRDKTKLNKCKTNGVKLFYYADYDYEFPYKVYKDKRVLLENIKKGTD